MEKSEGEMSHTYTTPRTLLSILRLAQSAAKIRFSRVVTEGDVNEALRLMAASNVGGVCTRVDVAGHSGVHCANGW